MTEVADAGEDHGYVEAVPAASMTSGSRDGTSGLDDGGGSGPSYGFEPIGEGEEGVGGSYGSGEGEDGLHRAEACCVHAAHLACADSDGLAVATVEAGVDDGVGFDVFTDAPGEEKRAELFVGGPAGGDVLEVVGGNAAAVGVLQEEAAGDLFQDARGFGGVDLDEA